MPLPAEAAAEAAGVCVGTSWAELRRQRSDEGQQRLLVARVCLGARGVSTTQSVTARRRLELESARLTHGEGDCAESDGGVRQTCRA